MAAITPVTSVSLVGVDPHVIDLHLGGKNGGGVGQPRPSAADSKGRQKDERPEEPPLHAVALWPFEEAIRTSIDCRSSNVAQREIILRKTVRIHFRSIEIGAWSVLN